MAKINACAVGSGGKEILTKEYTLTYVSGSYTYPAFTDFSEIFVVRTGPGGYATSYVDENGSLADYGSNANARHVTNINGNVVTISTQSGYEATASILITGFKA